MRSVVMEARDGLEAEYECTSLAGPHCRTHGPTGNLFTEPEVQSEDDGSLLIQLDDATIGKDGKIDLAKVMEMFGGGVMQKAKEAAAATNEARAARAAATISASTEPEMKPRSLPVTSLRCTDASQIERNGSSRTSKT